MCRVYGHPTDGIDGGTGRDGRSWFRYKSDGHRNLARRFILRSRCVSVAATVRAEVVGRFVDDCGCRSIRDTNLHATDGVDGVAITTAKPLLVFGKPVDTNCQQDEEDVQIRRVVPLEVSGRDRQRPGSRDGMEQPEDAFGRKPSGCHKDIEQANDPKGELRPVELPVDEDQGHGNEVGEDEGDHATKRDSTGPQRSGKGNVPDGTHPT